LSYEKVLHLVGQGSGADFIAVVTLPLVPVAKLTSACFSRHGNVPPHAFCRHGSQPERTGSTHTSAAGLSKQMARGRFIACSETSVRAWWGPNRFRVHQVLATAWDFVASQACTEEGVSATTATICEPSQSISDACHRCPLTPTSCCPPPLLCFFFSAHLFVRI
jgi:hypothetical protein